ncbi:helix-turn-helix domain-containing protein [Acidimangrovimonas pyrenivorans]|uniref:Helix-turn-helix domain-containing protein n=1 Tax=Acidimangrovimonas pyrenivorans TaxID=2030798 RepID=A0ABV7AE75_9RHOB
MTEAQAAEFLSISKRTLSDMRRSGEIQHSIVGKRGIRYEESDISEYLSRKKVRATPRILAQPRRGQARAQALLDII